MADTVIDDCETNSTLISIFNFFEMDMVANLSKNAKECRSIRYSSLLINSLENCTNDCVIAFSTISNNFVRALFRVLNVPKIKTKFRPFEAR